MSRQMNLPLLVINRPAMLSHPFRFDVFYKDRQAISSGAMRNCFSSSHIFAL
jgi:hypothetical protein